MSDQPGTDQPGGKLLRDSDFVKFWSGETVALAGAQITEMGLVLVAVVTLQASPFEIGLLNVFRYAPIVLSLLAGVWFDRNRRRPMLIVSNVGRAVLVAMVPLAAISGVLSMELLYGIGLLLGVLTVIFDVGSLSYVPGLVGRDHLAEANGKIQVSYSIAGIAGPGLAGLLVAALSAPNALFATSACYLVSVLTLVLIRRREPAPATPDEHTSVLASIGEGLRSVFANSVLRNLASQSATFNLFENVMTTLFAVYAVRQLGMSAAQLGLVIGAGAVGALIGAVASARLTKLVGLGRVMKLTTVLACTSPLLLLVPSGSGPAALAVLAVALAVHGFNLAVFNVNALTLRQVVTPAGLLGRMNASYRLLLFGTIPLGALLGGVLASAFGLRVGLTIGLIGLASPIVWLLFSPVFALVRLPSAPESDEGPPERQTHDENRKERETGHVV